MRFFTALGKSIYDIHWLKAARFGRGAAWRFFLLLTLLVTVVTIIPLVAGAPYALGVLKDAIQNKVPNFSAQVTKGKLSISGINQPYVYRTGEDNQNFVMVVNTVSTSTQSLSDYLQVAESGVLISADRIEIYDADREVSRTAYFKDAASGVIAKTDLLNALNKLTQPNTLILIGLACFVFVYLGLTIGKLMGVLLVTIIVYLVGLLARRRMTFGELFTIGLYAVVLPSILSIVLRVLGLGIGNIYFLALLAFMLAIMFTNDGTEQPAPPQTPTP